MQMTATCQIPTFVGVLPPYGIEPRNEARPLAIGSHRSVFPFVSSCKVCYWVLHSISLLGGSVPPDLAGDIVDFLSRCQDPQVDSEVSYFFNPSHSLWFNAPRFRTICRLCRRIAQPGTHLYLCDGFVLHRNSGSI